MAGQYVSGPQALAVHIQKTDTMTAESIMKRLRTAIKEQETKTSEEEESTLTMIHIIRDGDLPLDPTLSSST